MKITIYSLDGCSSCESLRSKLKESFIAFTDIKCNGDVSICDKIESITNCETYPIIKIEKDYSESLILCIAKDQNQLGSTQRHKNNVIFYVHSINNMLDAIKKM